MPGSKKLFSAASRNTEPNPILYLTATGEQLTWEQWRLSRVRVSSIEYIEGLALQLSMHIPTSRLNRKAQKINALLRSAQMIEVVGSLNSLPDDLRPLKPMTRAKTLTLILRLSRCLVRSTATRR